MTDAQKASLLMYAAVIVSPLMVATILFLSAVK